MFCLPDISKRLIEILGLGASHLILEVWGRPRIIVCELWITSDSITGGTDWGMRDFQLAQPLPFSSSSNPNASSVSEFSNDPMSDRCVPAWKQIIILTVVVKTGNKSVLVGV